MSQSQSMAGRAAAPAVAAVPEAILSASTAQEIPLPIQEHVKAMGFEEFLRGLPVTGDRDELVLNRKPEQMLNDLSRNIDTLRDSVVILLHPEHPKPQPNNLSDEQITAMSDQLTKLLLECAPEQREELLATIEKMLPYPSGEFVRSTIQRLFDGEELSSAEKKLLLRAVLEDGDALVAVGMQLAKSAHASPELRTVMEKTLLSLARTLDEIQEYVARAMAQRYNRGPWRQHEESDKRSIPPLPVEEPARHTSSDRPAPMPALKLSKDEKELSEWMLEEILSGLLLDQEREEKADAETAEERELDEYFEEQAWKMVINYVASHPELTHDPAALSALQKDYVFPPSPGVIQMLREVVRRHNGIVGDGEDHQLVLPERSREDFMPARPTSTSTTGAQSQANREDQSSAPESSIQTVSRSGSRGAAALASSN